MVIVCENTEHFSVIDDLVNHLDKLHEKSPCHVRWIVFHTLVTMRLKDPPDRKNDKNSIVLDVKMDFHKWWLAAHQCFKTIIIQPSNLVCLEDQAAHAMVPPKHNKSKPT